MKNPHQMAVDDERVDAEMDAASNTAFLAQKTKVGAVQPEVIYAIHLGDMLHDGMMHVIVVYAQRAPSANWRAQAAPNAHDDKGTRYHAIVFNTALHSSKHQIRRTMYHETIHIIFGIKSRVDTDISASAATEEATESLEGAKRYLGAETEFEARALSFTKAIEDTLDTKSKAAALRIANNYMHVLTHTEDRNWLPWLIQDIPAFSQVDRTNMMAYALLPEKFDRLKVVVFYSMQDYVRRRK